MKLLERLIKQFSRFRQQSYTQINRVAIALVSVAIFWVAGFNSMAIAAPNSGMLSQPPIEVKVSLGSSTNELKFVPNDLEFASGKRYKLLLDNPSPQKHYFTAKDFADVIWTQKVEAGKVEVKGAIKELELKPGANAEWLFVPLKPGKYSLRCTVPGHTEAGMTGVITVS
jgi:uncharacterized cupredoxin-like copper-binding protein